LSWAKYFNVFIIIIWFSIEDSDESHMVIVFVRVTADYSYPDWVYFVDLFAIWGEKSLAWRRDRTHNLWSSFSVRCLWLLGQQQIFCTGSSYISTLNLSSFSEMELFNFMSQNLSYLTKFQKMLERPLQ